jgi:hypothetical protein
MTEHKELLALVDEFHDFIQTTEGWNQVPPHWREKIIKIDDRLHDILYGYPAPVEPSSRPRTASSDPKLEYTSYGNDTRDITVEHSTIAASPAPEGEQLLMQAYQFIEPLTRGERVDDLWIDAAKDWLISARGQSPSGKKEEK